MTFANLILGARTKNFEKETYFLYTFDNHLMNLCHFFSLHISLSFGIMSFGGLIATFELQIQGWYITYMEAYKQKRK